MSTPGITIPASDMNLIVQKAILDSLSSETKETMIAAALQHLMTKTKAERYESTPSGPSPMEYAFQEAIRKVANEVAREVVEEARPKLAETFRKLLAEVDFDTVDENDFAMRLMGTIIAYSRDKTYESFRR